MMINKVITMTIRRGRGLVERVCEWFEQFTHTHSNIYEYIDIPFVPVYDLPMTTVSEVSSSTPEDKYTYMRWECVICRDILEHLPVSTTTIVMYCTTMSFIPMDTYS